MPSTAAAPLHPPPRGPGSRSFYDVDDESNKQDVGSQPGTSWTLSSFKQGSGVAELRSRDMSKLWQSDGMQPHLITITFSRLTHLTHVSLFLDVRQDDSYTPTKLAIKAGTHMSDLITVRTRTFDSPQGWKHFLLDKSDDSTPEEEEEEQEREGEDGGKREGIWCWTVQVCVLANHLNGKDTHVRRCVVWGSRDEKQQDHAETSRERQWDEQEARAEVKRALMASHPAAQTHESPATQSSRTPLGLDELLSRAQQRSAGNPHSSARRGLDRFGRLR